MRVRGDGLKVFGVVAASAVLLSACGQSTPAAGGEDKLARGAYLVAVGACGDCHTPGALLGKPEMDKVYGGSNVGFQIPEVGYFYPPNLTPDNDTGLGKWSEADIARAIRAGERPDGRKLVPVMPYYSYAKMSEDDALAMAAYLKSLRPLSNKVPGPFGASETPTAPYQTVVFPQAAAAPTAPEPAPAAAPTTP
jgi:mono/diheme cytochrome c family protein